MNFRRSRQQDEGGFDIAPMIDIMFLLLIFFMVASVFAQWETKMDIQVPTAETGKQPQRSPVEIIVNLDKDGHIFINDFEQTPEALKNTLGRIARLNEGHPVIIRADQETDYSFIIKVLDICRQVDVWNVSFATLPADTKSGP